MTLSDLRLPTDPADLDLAVLNRLIGAQNPGLAVEDFVVNETHLWGGGQASSAGRIIITPRWAGASTGGGEVLPRRLVLKVARAFTDRPDTPNPVAGAGGALYANEVAVYGRLCPWQVVEAPRGFGGAYDPASNAQLLILEDLSERGASFGSVIRPVSLDLLRSLLGELAKLHARWWASPELGTTLGWMEAHTRGRLHQQFSTPGAVNLHIANQVATEQFKREMVERMGTTADALFHAFRRVQAHQASLPQTVCHGDTHIANTYALPGEKGGLLDWQLTSQGFCLHDVSYLIATALSVGERRRHERALLAEYREMLRAAGVGDAPPLDLLWDEYRRAMVWGLYIGWLTTPVVNYGWEVTVMAHLRMATACEDLETLRAIAALD